MDGVKCSGPHLTLNSGLLGFVQSLSQLSCFYIYYEVGDDLIGT